jgi:Nitrogen regulatory protein P-II
MKRVELIANQSVEDDIFEAFEKRDIVKKFTKIPSVHGSGNSTSKRGDHIWPEENFMLLVFCEDSEAQQIKEAVSEVKVLFEDEGIKLFISNM